MASSNRAVRNDKINYAARARARLAKLLSHAEPETPAPQNAAEG